MLTLSTRDLSNSSELRRWPVKPVNMTITSWFVSIAVALTLTTSTARGHVFGACCLPAGTCEDGGEEGACQNIGRVIEGADCANGDSGGPRLAMSSLRTMEAGTSTPRRFTSKTLSISSLCDIVR